jgi:hypothetical protein
MFPENETGPPLSYIFCGITQSKSARLHTSMYPPILFTLKITPVSDSLLTETGPAICAPDVGFTY